MRLELLGWIVLLGLGSGCAMKAGVSPVGPEQGGPAATPEAEAARLDQEMQRLESELVGPAEATADPRPDCDRACDLGRRICALAGRICLLSAAHPGQEIQARCEDAMIRCSRARALLEEACGCQNRRETSVP